MRKKKSIIVDDMEHCKLCGSPYVEIHHCLHGTANRKKADKYNLVIPLCHDHAGLTHIKVLTARKRIKESVNTAYRYGYAKRN